MLTLRTTEPLHIGGVVLIPVQRVRVERSRGRGEAWVRAFLEPHAIVLDEGEDWRAFDAQGEPLALELLVQEVPGLAEAIERERPGESSGPGAAPR